MKNATFTDRWTYARKVSFVWAASRMTEEEFRQALIDNYISEEEFHIWQTAVNARNMRALRAAYVGARI